MKILKISTHLFSRKFLGAICLFIAGILSGTSFAGEAITCFPASLNLTDSEDAGGATAAAIVLQEKANCSSSDSETGETMIGPVKLGDINGDGYSDFALEAITHDISAASADEGALYVIYGKDFTGYGDNTYKYTDVGSTLSGFRLYGDSTEDHFGKLAVGDLNSDGVNDLLIGSSYHDSGYGLVQLVYGSTTAEDWGSGGKVGDVADASLEGLVASTLSSPVQTLNIGVELVVSDLDGDGDQDTLFLGQTGIFYAEEGYIFACAGFPSSFGDCFAFRFTKWGLGGNISTGDFNGDGCTDILTGDGNDLAAYVILQQTKAVRGSSSRTCAGFSGYMGYRSTDYTMHTFYAPGCSATTCAIGIPYRELADVGISPAPTKGKPTIYGVQFTGTTYFGKRTAFAGDVNGDGKDDVLISDYGWDPDSKGIAVGRVYLVYGITGYYYKVIDEADIPTSYGYLFGGDEDLVRATKSAYGQKLGRTVKPAGDLNKDGYADFFIGTQAGQAYLVAGSKTKHSGSGPIASATGVVVFVGPASPDRGDIFATGVGDVNGDGYEDAVIEDQGNSNQTAYLINGMPFCF